MKKQSRNLSRPDVSRIKFLLNALMSGILPENFGNNGPDLAAYPVIRLDHIPLLSGKLLETALGDVGDLLGVMHSKASNGESVPKLAFYLQKQMDAMRLEASKRFAQSEVSARLQQVESILSAATAPAHVPQLQLKSHDAPISRSGPSVAGSISSRTSALRDDLDSALAEKPAATSRSQNQVHLLSVPEPTPGPVVFKSSSSESSRRPLMEGVEFVPAPVAKASTAEPAVRPRPAPTVEPFVVGDAVFSVTPAATSSGFASSSSVASAGSKKRAKNKRTSESISYRAWKPVDSLNVNFATEFVVAAPDEHRVSRYALPPKKKEPQPDPEEQREREKQARREAAARRLAERRAAQIQQKRQRRPTSSVTSEPTAVNAKPGHDSGEDSVSEEEPDDGFGDASASAETDPAAAATATVKQPSPQLQPQMQPAQTKRMKTEGIDKNGSKGRGSDRGKSKGKAVEGSKSDGAQLAQLHDQLDAANKSVQKLKSELAAAVKAQPQQQRRQQQQQQQQQQQATKEQQFVDAQRRAEAVARVARAVAGAGASASASTSASASASERSDARVEKTQSGNGNAKGAVARAPSRAATGTKTSAPKSTEASSPITAATAAPSSPRDQPQPQSSPGDSSPLRLPLPAHALLPPELRPLQDQNQGHGQAEQDSPASRQRRDDFQAKSGAALETVRRLKLQRQGSQGNVLVAADSEIGGSRDAAPASVSPRKLSPRPNYQEIDSNGPPSNANTSVVNSCEDLPKLEDGRQPIPISNNSEAMVTPRRLHSTRDLVRPEGSSDLAQPFPIDAADLGSASSASSPLHATVPLLQLVRGARRTEAEWEDAQHLDADGEDPEAVDFYACSRGPDELLGLRVWRLMDVEFDFREEEPGAGSGAGAARGQWAIDMASYHEPVPEEELLQLELLRMTRSTVRRKVSAGLIALVLGCEELMTGANARLYASQDQDALRAAWQRALLSFDQMASQLSEEHAEKLFDEVWVCGNGHAVCRKLEGLVKSQVFAFENSLTCFSDAAQLLAVNSPSQRSGSWEVSRLEGFVHGEEGGEFDDDDVGVGGEGRGGKGEGAVDESWVEDTWIEEQEGQKDLAVDQRQQQLQQLQRIVYDGLSMAELGVEPVDEDDEDEEEDDDDDDDGSILPMYTQLLAPVATVPNALSSQVQPRPQPQPGKELDRQRQSLQPRQNKKSHETRSARGGQGQALVTTTSASNLKVAFPLFGAIFPATYGANGPSMPPGPGAAGASLLLTPHVHRAVVGSLEAQSKMYCEWLEVMSDYSTSLSLPLSTANTDPSGARSKYYRVNSSRSEVYSIVTDALTTQPCFAEWEELPAGLGLGATWNLLWTWSKPRLSLPTMLVWQRVNHFHDSKQLTRKDLLKKNLQRYTGMGGRAAGAFEIMPQTFLLPQEYIHFVQAFQEIEARRLEAGVQNYWIMKPVGMSRGRGISLVRDVASLAYSQTSVIQRYVERPLCLDGYKFDLRLYVLVTSFRPLEAFIYTEGFARVSTARYSLDGADMANRFIHLTNSSIQKQNTAGPSKDNPLRNPAGGDGAEAAARGGNGGGSKLTLQGPNGLWARLRLVGIDPDQVWSDIQLCVLKSLVVVDEKMTFQPCSFELFGYDVLIDSDLRPWLLEVNASPSLARENAVDHEIKNALIRDTITLVDPPAYDRAQAAKIFRRRSAELAKGGGGGAGGGGRQNDPDLQADLQAILLERPRAYAEDPRTPGLYERLCPNTRVYEKAIKLKSKIFKA